MMTTQTQVKPFREPICAKCGWSGGSDEIQKCPKCGTENIKVRINFHSGQTRAWLSKKRYVVVLAGSQGGKTCFGPHWLEREIKTCGAGDYLIATSTFPLLDKTLLREFLIVFDKIFHYGEYDQNRKIFTCFTKDTLKDKRSKLIIPDSVIPTRIIIGSAQNPESMESATVKGIWLDEVGQNQFKRESWEAIERRGAINKARILMTTTLYCLGWLKTEIYDKGISGKDPDIDIIQFPSTVNPRFSVGEFKRLKSTMPDWKFQMFHEGKYSKPAGMIYDALTAEDIIEPFEIPANWPRYVGHDFGPSNTVALWKAYDPATGTFYTYREYSAGNLSTFEHVSNWIELSKGERIALRMGGSPTEDGWRGDFCQAGWKIEKPLDGHVESGIQRVYGYEKLHKHKVFRTCQNYLSEKQSYSRELDENYNVTDKIEDKSSYHFCDAERYIMTHFRQVAVGRQGKEPVAVHW